MGKVHFRRTKLFRVPTCGSSFFVPAYEKIPPKHPQTYTHRNKASFILNGRLFLPVKWSGIVAPISSQVHFPSAHGLPIAGSIVDQHLSLRVRTGAPEKKKNVP